MNKNLIAFLLLFSSLISQNLHAQQNATPLQVKTHELYVGILGRAADGAGLDYWVDQINAGVFTLENTRAAFTDPAQAEYTEIYGGLDNTQLVTAVYENLLERAPEIAGLLYWVDELDSGRVNADQMINAVINAVQDPGASGEESARDLAVLQNKTEASLHFTEATRDSPFNAAFRVAARAAVSDVTDDLNTVLASKTLTNIFALARTGQFIDSLVEGLNYESPTGNGITNASGEFNYEAHEVVQFRIGQLVLGEVVGTEDITPMELVPGATSPDDPNVTNILRLLQSLDADCNPENGIQITSSTRNAADQAMTIPATRFEFEADSHINALLGTVSCRTSLVAAVDARVHYQLSMQQALQDALEDVIVLTAGVESGPRAAIDSAGNTLALLPGDESRGESMRVVFTTARGDAVIIAVNSLGLPGAIYFTDGTVMILTNHTSESVDALLVPPGGPLTAEALAQQAAVRLDLPPQATSFFNAMYHPAGASPLLEVAAASSGIQFRTDIDLIDSFVNEWLVPTISTVGHWLVQNAYADDVSQVINDGMENAVAIVKYIDVAGDVHATLQGVTTTTQLLAKLGKSTVVDALWKASLQNVDLNKDEQRVVDLLNQGLKCGAIAPNPFDCAEFVLSSAAAYFDVGYEIGTIFYDTYVDLDRLEALELALAEMDFENRPPVAFLDSPEDGSYHMTGSVIQFSGHAVDVNGLENAQFTWSSSRDGVLGTGEALYQSTLSEGMHTITFAVTDSTGRTSNEPGVSIEVGNAAPVVNIAFPDSGAAYPPGETIIFSGSAEDPEDGTLSGDSLVWTYNGNGTVLGTGTTINIDNLPAPTQGTFTHVVNLTATDSGGASSSETIRVKISTLGAPIVRIAIYRLPGAWFLSAQDVNGRPYPDNVARWENSSGKLLLYGNILGASPYVMANNSYTFKAIVNVGGIEGHTSVTWNILDYPL